MFYATRKSLNVYWPSILAGLVLAHAASPQLLAATDFSSYRGFRFGTNLAATAKQAGIPTVDAKMIHQRPAVIQEMEWRPGSPSVLESSKPDPVKEALLQFYNGELFRIVVTYDSYKIEGMTVNDMVEAISATYGAASRPEVEIPFHSNYAETAKVLARWGSADYSYDLVRTGNQSSFGLVLYSRRVDALAQASASEAVRLDALEAPQRERADQDNREKERRLVLEKARLTNRPNFKP